MIMDLRTIFKRGSTKYKQIKTVKTQTGVCHHISISKETSNNFSGCSLFEIQTEQGIFLAKSGCDINITIRQPQIEKNYEKR